MRGVAEAVAGLRVEMTEGVRAEIDGGWVLVLPHPVEPVVTLYAEGSDGASADALLDEYRGIVTELLKA